LSKSAGRKHSAWYALRRTLPPWNFDRNLQELVECLPRYRVDEVIVKIDTEEFSHGQPPLDWVRAYQRNLFRIKAAMEKIGVAYSLNPWITVGHNDRGRDSRKSVPALRTIVGHDGTRCKVCACPLSKAWREHVSKIWTLYAETEPRVIWIEDDIRTFNHLPVEFGCFCAEHMKRFSERVGRKVSREELVRAILKSGEPHPWRAEYLDMQAEIMIDTVGFLARVVHRASPGTCMGLMSSGPRNHCLEGRRWKDFASALADGGAIYSRAPMGNYSENSLRGLYYSHDSIKITRFCMPSGAIEQTEVENVPFTQYSKSVAFTFLQMSLSFAFGSHGVTLNLFDHCGSPMESDPSVGRMLAREKAFLNALAERCAEPGIYRGVRLAFHEKQSYHKRLPKGATYGMLVGDGEQLMRALESHGIPTTYEDSAVSALSGQTVRALGDEEIREILKRGCLVDGRAAHVLYERGFSRELGLERVEEPRHLDELGEFSAEEFFEAKFGGANKMFLTLTMPDLAGRPDFAVMEPARRAEVVSRIVDPDGNRLHVCMYAYENALGGRVVVGALDISTAFGAAYCHPYRARQLQKAVRWLSRGKPPILVRGGVYPLAFRKDCADYSVVGAFNLSLDPWPSIEFELADARRIEKLEVLSPSGIWRKSKVVSSRASKGMVTLEYAREVPFDRPVMITIHWKRRRSRAVELISPGSVP